MSDGIRNLANSLASWLSGFGDSPFWSCLKCLSSCRILFSISLIDSFEEMSRNNILCNTRLTWFRLYFSSFIFWDSSRVINSIFRSCILLSTIWHWMRSTAMEHYQIRQLTWTCWHLHGSFPMIQTWVSSFPNRLFSSLLCLKPSPFLYSCPLVLLKYEKRGQAATSIVQNLGLSSVGFQSVSTKSLKSYQDKDARKSLSSGLTFSNLSCKGASPKSIRLFVGSLNVASMVRRRRSTSLTSTA